MIGEDGVILIPEAWEDSVNESGNDVLGRDSSANELSAGSGSSLKVIIDAIGNNLPGTLVGDEDSADGVEIDDIGFGVLVGFFHSGVSWVDDFDR